MSNQIGDVMMESVREDNKDRSSPTTKPSKPCVCPKCGTLIPSLIETPCYKRVCPKCENRMLSL